MGTKLNFRLWLLCIFACMCVQLADAQTVKGIVRDGAGEAVIGCGVRVKGAKSGATVTDVNGAYSINVPNLNVTLTFTAIGMKTQDVKVGGRTQIDVKLEDNNTLGEAVVVGYGTAKRSDITGSVASLTTDQLKQSIVQNADQMLQGKIAGVQVTQNSGQPGAATSIRIRGASSINNSNEPLYIIDGVQMANTSNDIGGFSWAGGSNGQSKVNPLAAIAPSDIVNITVLKDASACAIYGAAGANGVVIVETRRGKKGHTNVSYDGYVGWQQTAKRLDMMNLRQYAQYQKQLFDEGILSSTNMDDAYLDPSLLGEGTDWQDEIFRTAFQQSHQLNISGGNETTTFSASAGWMQQDGIIIGSDFDRFNTRFNFDSQFTKWMKLGGSLAYTRTNEKVTLNDGSDGVIMQAMTMQPGVPVRDFDGNWAGPSTTSGSSTWNPVALALDKNNTLLRQRIMGSFYGSFDFLKYFNLRVEYAFDASNNLNKSYVPRYSFGAVSNDINQMYQREDHSFYWVQKDYVTYHQVFAQKHDVQVMAGFEASQSSWESSALIKKNFTTDNIQVMGADGEYVSNTGSKDGATTASVYARFNYGFDNRYLATFTMRSDGSSKFGPANKWGYFPSAALAWRINQEKFLQGVHQINNLKLRLGWGRVGNSNIDNYLYSSAMSSIKTPQGTAYFPKNLSNAKLKWESSEQFNVGLDLGLFNSRVELTIDWYRKQSKDLLMQVFTPDFLASNDWLTINAPTANIGKTRNTGIDVSLNLRPVVTKNFSWDANITVSHNKNEVVSLNDNTQIMYGNVDWWAEFQTATMIKVGQPMGVFYGYIAEGLFKDADDIRAHATQVGEGAYNNTINKTTGVWVGDMKFKDLNGDGIIDTNDQTIIGDPNPDFTFGFTNTFSYKSFDLTIGLTGAVGGDILNWARMKTEGLNSIWDNQDVAVLNRAQYGYHDGNSANQDIENIYLANPGAEIPRFSSLDANRNNRMSTRFLEDGTYLRVQNVSLAWNAPQSLIKRIGLSAAKVYLNVQNLYTFTKYSGYDPEIGAYNQSSLLQNIDRGRYPTPRSYTLGLNLTF